MGLGLFVEPVLEQAQKRGMLTELISNNMNIFLGKSGEYIEQV
jgi:hypothetical protein